MSSSAGQWVWSRWQPCGDWAGTVEEAPQDGLLFHGGRWRNPNDPEWRTYDYDQNDVVFDLRRVRMLIGGADWLRDLWTQRAQYPYGAHIRLRAYLRRRGERRGWTGQERLVLHGPYGRAMDDAGGLRVDPAKTVYDAVGSVARLEVWGQRRISLEPMHLVRLAHPWRGTAPGRYRTVTGDERRRLAAQGYLAR